MPFKRSTYNNWEVIGVEPIVIKNQDSGKTVTLQDDGTAEAESLKVGQATVDGSRLYIQDAEPTDASAGDVWIDTS